MKGTMRIILLAGALGLSAQAGIAATTDRNPVKAVVDAWSKGDYKQAIKDWRGPAAKGDADAEFNLGQAYKLGRGVPADMAQARDWYRKAALQGHFQAEDNYGLLLFQDGQQAAAAPWLEKSAARGEPRAELVLGTMLFNGDGGQARDWPRAYALMTRSSQSGLPQATQTLADMDKYIPIAQRKKGLALARQYETQAQQAHLPPEITGAPGPTAIRTTSVPPSTVAQTDTTAPGARYPAPRANAPHKAPPPAPTHTAPPAPPPPPAPARHVETPPPIAGKAWRIQLGAFSTEARARHLWESVSHRVSALHGAQPYLVHAGSITRLQAGPFASSAAAASACAAVKRTGNACFAVAP